MYFGLERQNTYTRTTDLDMDTDIHQSESTDRKANALPIAFGNGEMCRVQVYSPIQKRAFQVHI